MVTANKQYAFLLLELVFEANGHCRGLLSFLNELGAPALSVEAAELNASFESRR